MYHAHHTHHAHPNHQIQRCIGERRALRAPTLSRSLRAADLGPGLWNIVRWWGYRVPWRGRELHSKEVMVRRWSSCTPRSKKICFFTSPRIFLRNGPPCKLSCACMDDVFDLVVNHWQPRLSFCRWIGCPSQILYCNRHLPAGGWWCPLGILLSEEILHQWIWIISPFCTGKQMVQDIFGQYFCSVCRLTNHCCPTSQVEGGLFGSPCGKDLWRVGSLKGVPIGFIFGNPGCLQRCFQTSSTWRRKKGDPIWQDPKNHTSWKLHGLRTI